MEDGSMKELTSQHDIEAACVQENYNKYTQTESTEYMQEPLKTMLGKTGNTSFCQRILEGAAEFPPNTPQYTVEFFQQLQQVDNSQENNTQVKLSSEDFEAGWKVMKEKLRWQSKQGCTLEV